MDLQKFRPARRLLLAVGVAAGLVAAPLSAPLAATATASIDGVWQTDGYGMIVAVDNGKAQLYSTTTISCTPAAIFRQDGNRFTTKDEQAFTVQVKRDRATMHVEGNVGDKRLRRLESLPKSCTGPGATGPLAAFDQFWTDYAEKLSVLPGQGDRLERGPRAVPAAGQAGPVRRRVVRPARVDDQAAWRRAHRHRDP
jgi:hypothetical protein